MTENKIVSIEEIELKKKRWVRYESNVTKRQTILSILNEWKSDKLAMLEEIDKKIEFFIEFCNYRQDNYIHLDKIGEELKELKQSLGGGQ
jgi:hypothetical protein